MKYIDADKFIKKFEKMIDDIPASVDSGAGYVIDEVYKIFDSLQQEQPESTCKTCGFYENNCPFIRGKLIPYPNKVCKDYTYSVVKAQEQSEPFSCGHENGYDEAYLQEKIAKASKTWEGVDADKYLDEVRGREQGQPQVADASKMEHEVDLEKFAEKIKTFQGRYKHPEIVSIKGAMAFMARLFYQYPNTAREWYESLPKATMDNVRKEE